jgi:superfamily II DNA or RNA helicase
MATAIGALSAEQRARLRFTPRVLGGRAPPVVCYERYEPHGDKYIFPLFGAGSDVTGAEGAHATSAEAPGAEMEAALEFVGSLRDEQKQTAAALEATIRARRAALCELPTGGGKTVVALWLAARLGVRTLVVVHTRVLLEQWKQRAAQFVRGDVEIGMLQTLRRAAPRTDVGFVVYDEVHHTCAHAFSRVMFRIRPRYALGLSATTTRLDGLECVLHAFFGKPTVQKAKARQARVEVLRLPDFGVVPVTRHNHALGRACVVVSRLVSDLAKSAPRTELLVETARAMCARGRRVLVLTHRREHCLTFDAMLRERGVRSCAVLGGSKRAEHELECIVGTAGVVAEGFDEPWLDTLLFATPQVSVTQAVGRILRRDPAAAGEFSPLVVDPVDPIPTCYAQFRRRRAAYLAAGHRLAPADDALDGEAPVEAEHERDDRPVSLFVAERE